MPAPFMPSGKPVQDCQVCNKPLDNVSPGVMIVAKPGHANMEVCGSCLPAMLFNGWQEIARAR